MKERSGQRKISILLAAVLVISLLCGNGGFAMVLYPYGGSRKTSTRLTALDTASPSELEDGTVSEAAPAPNGTGLEPVSIRWNTSNTTFYLDAKDANGNPLTIYYLFTDYKTDISSFTGAFEYTGGVDLGTRSGTKFRIYAVAVDGNQYAINATLACWDCPDDMSCVEISWPDEKHLQLDGYYTAEKTYYCITGYGTDMNYDALMNESLEYSGPVDISANAGVRPFRIYAWLGDLDADTDNATICYKDHACVLPEITADPGSGQTAKGTKVSLKSAGSLGNPDAIRYTLNDDTPTENSTLYTGPISIDSSTVIRARAFYDGKTVENGWIPVISAFRYTVPSGKADRYEVNDVMAQATDVSFPLKTDAMISAEADKDYYRFTINAAYAGKPFMLSLTSPAGLVYGLSLFDRNGNLIETKTLNGNQSISVATCSAGESFYAEVFSMNGAFSDTESYTLRIYPSEKATGSNLERTPDYSEMNLLTSWFGNTDGDQTPYTGYDGRTIDGYSEGENSQRAVNYYSEWYGPVDENVQAYGNKTGTNIYPFVDAHDRVPYHLQNAIFLPQTANVEDRSEFVSMLKNLIYSYGAVYITYGHDSDSLNAVSSPGDADFEKYYYDSTITEDAVRGFHAVCVAGWDDTREAALFRNRKGEQPQNNGAFLIKNSWGEGGIGGDEKGFFWMSYETASLGLPVGDNPTAYIMEEAADSYDRQYLNDATGFHDMNTLLEKAAGSFQASNTFTADGHDQLLKAVSLVTTGEEDHYDISITADGQTSKILSGTEKYAGYYTKRLEEPVLIKANSTFTLTETMYNDSGTVGFAYGYGAAEPGLAYIYMPDQADLSANGAYPCLRAFTVIPDKTGGSPQIICRVPYNDSYGQSGTSGAAGKNPVKSGSIGTGNGSAGTITRAATDYTAGAVDTGDLPKVYDLRQQGLITNVKNQDPYGDCWTFGSTAAVESSVLLNGGAENGVRFSYPRKVTLTSKDQTTFLTGNEQTKTVRATAQMDTSQAPSRKIFWTFTGDTGEDYITVLNNSSFADEDTELFTFKKPGVVTVTATCDADINVKDSMTFTATSEGITGITLAVTDLRLEKGSTGQVLASFTPEDAWDSTLLYTSDHPEIAYVDEHTGMITALSAGRAKITVTGGSASAVMTVRVYSGDNGSNSGGENDGSVSGGNTDYTDPVKGHMNTGKGILTGSGKDYSKWFSVTDPVTGLITWKLQYANGTNAAGTWEKVNGLWYKFNAAGIMQTGWILDNGRWYYLDPVNGDMKTGYLKAPDGNWYYFLPDGSMAVGDIVIDGVTHHFNGQMPESPTYTKDPVTGEWKPNGNSAVPYGAEKKQM